jgi:outer membrane protein assembly factor BamB
MRARLLPWLLVALIAVLVYSPVRAWLKTWPRVQEIRAAAPQDVVAPPIAVAAEDWPWWRGSDRRGVVAVEDASLFPFRVPDNVRWRVPVPGRGHASPIVCGDAVYILTADEAEQSIQLLAFDIASGEQRWSCLLFEGGFEKVHVDNTHASSTPACDGAAVYCAALTRGALRIAKVDLGGQLVWTAEAGPYESYHGYAASVVLHDRLVIVGGDNPGTGFIAALDRGSGDIAWRTARANQPSHSSPSVVVSAGREQLIYTGQQAVVSYDPRTGVETWRVKGTSDETANTVAADDLRIYASSGYPQGRIQAFAADGSGQLAWERNINVYVPSLLLVEGRLLAATDNGVLRMLDAATGRDLWTKRFGGEFSASPVACGNIALVINEAGKGAFIRLGDKWESVGEIDLGSPTFATPAIARGCVFLRTANELICIAQPAVDRPLP